MERVDRANYVADRSWSDSRKARALAEAYNDSPQYYGFCLKGTVNLLMICLGLQEYWIWRNNICPSYGLQFILLVDLSNSYTWSFDILAWLCCAVPSSISASGGQSAWCGQWFWVSRGCLPSPCVLWRKTWYSHRYWAYPGVGWVFSGEFEEGRFGKSFAGQTNWNYCWRWQTR